MRLQAHVSPKQCKKGRLSRSETGWGASGCAVAQRRSTDGEANGHNRAVDILTHVVAEHTFPEPRCQMAFSATREEHGMACGSLELQGRAPQPRGVGEMFAPCRSTFSRTRFIIPLVVVAPLQAFPFRVAAASLTPCLPSVRARSRVHGPGGAVGNHPSPGAAPMPLAHLGRCFIAWSTPEC